MNFRPVVVKLTDVILHDDALLIQVIINVATAGVWDYISCGPVPIYSLTKNGGTMLLQQIAKDVDPEKLRIVSYHPGLIKTDATKNLFPLGYVVPWDTRKSPGHAPIPDLELAVVFF